jgi:hypothetical protein
MGVHDAEDHGLARRGSLEWVVFSVRSLLGLGDVGEQLDKPDGRLLQGTARSEAIWNALSITLISGSLSLWNRSHRWTYNRVPAESRSGFFFDLKTALHQSL